MFNRPLIAFCLTLLMATPVAAQGFQKEVEGFAAVLREWQPLADAGDPDAQFNLGVIYENGEGIPKDNAEAARWYRLAAEQGHAYAQYNLGVMYENGDGVLQDVVQAVLWYRRAAEQGHASAQNNLGSKYTNGEGVQEDFVAAHMWWNLAAAQGNDTAANNKKRYSNIMSREQLAKAQRLSRECLARNYKDC